MFKRYNRLFSATILFLMMCLLSAFSVSQAFAAAGPPSLFNNMPGINSLEEDVSQWHIYHDQGYTKGTLQNVTKENDGTLKVTLMHGSQAYAGIHAYRELPAADKATQFRMDVSFMFTNDKPVQALEFTMNKWVDNVRWEWALQWQIVPDGSALAATPETWRVWNGYAWQSLQVQQDLTVKKWHMLHLYGDITNGFVHYVGFSCDNVYTDMGLLSFNPVASSGDKLAVGLQLDGNSEEMHYPVFYNNVNLHDQ